MGMSLKDKFDEIVVSTESKILVFDIERMKGTASVEFWDLGDYKNRRISADDVVEWPRTICVAWNWYGYNKINFASEWGDGREDMLQQVWDAFDEADILVGHNIVGFDIKRLNTEWRDMGLRPPSPYKTVDTLQEARKYFGDESRTLDALCKRLGIDAKTDKYDVEVARAALAGDRKAQITIQSYNEGDIVASIGLFNEFRGWAPTRPHLGELDSERLVCNQCGSEDMSTNGTYLARQIRYIAYRCNHCGANLKGKQHSRTGGISGAS